MLQARGQTGDPEEDHLADIEACAAALGVVAEDDEVVFIDGRLRNPRCRCGDVLNLHKDLGDVARLEV